MKKESKVLSSCPEDRQVIAQNTYDRPTLLIFIPDIQSKR